MADQVSLSLNSLFDRDFYLQAYPGELISGIDPLQPKQGVDFELVRGISEYLPWPDGSFSTVISATSLDHCLSLRRSLEEMIRVLCPNGTLLLWIGSKPGAPEYNPDDSDFIPADQFHLFHFDEQWFDPLLERTLEITHRFKFIKAGYSHIFYCLRT